MQNPLPIKQDHRRLHRRILQQSLHKRHLPIRKIRRDERKPRLQRHRPLLHYCTTPIVQTNVRTNRRRKLILRIRHINTSHNHQRLKIIHDTNFRTQPQLLTTQLPQRKLRRKLIKKHLGKINDPAVLHPDMIRSKTTHLIRNPKTKTTQPTIRMHNLETRHTLRVRILIHHPTHRPRRHKITQRLRHRPIRRHHPRRHLTNQTIRILEKIHTPQGTPRHSKNLCHSL